MYTCLLIHTCVRMVCRKASVSHENILDMCLGFGGLGGGGRRVEGGTVMCSRLVRHQLSVPDCRSVFVYHKMYSTICVCMGIKGYCVSHFIFKSNPSPAIYSDEKKFEKLVAETSLPNQRLI